MAAEFDFAAVRAQGEPAAVRLIHHLRPPAVELELLHALDFSDLDLQHVAADGQALVIARMTLDTAKREKQHQHFDACERKNQPRAKPGKSRSNSEGNECNKTKSEDPVRRGERVVAAGS